MFKTKTKNWYPCQYCGVYYFTDTDAYYCSDCEHSPLLKRMIARLEGEGGNKKVNKNKSRRYPLMSGDNTTEQRSDAKSIYDANRARDKQRFKNYFKTFDYTERCNLETDDIDIEMILDENYDDIVAGVYELLDGYVERYRAEGKIKPLKCVDGTCDV